MHMDTDSSIVSAAYSIRENSCPFVAEKFSRDKKKDFRHE